MNTESRDSRRLPGQLEQSLRAIAEALDAAGLAWLLTGSAMRALRGFDVAPRDLDIEVAGDDSAAAALALGLPPPGVDADERVRSLRSGGQGGGVDVDLTADLVVYGRRGRLDADFSGQLAAARGVTIGGSRILLAPIEETLARADALEDQERRAQILTGAPKDFTVDEDWIRRRLSAASPQGGSAEVGPLEEGAP